MHRKGDGKTVQFETDSLPQGSNETSMSCNIVSVVLAMPMTVPNLSMLPHCQDKTRTNLVQREQA